MGIEEMVVREGEQEECGLWKKDEMKRARQ